MAEPGDTVNHDAAVAAMALGAKASKLLVLGERPHGRASEHDIVVAAISVILTALFTIIAVAAVAIFSMG